MLPLVCQIGGVALQELARQTAIVAVLRSELRSLVHSQLSQLREATAPPASAPPAAIPAAMIRGGILG
jgi:hypothetical protein